MLDNQPSNTLELLVPVSIYGQETVNGLIAAAGTFTVVTIQDRTWLVTGIEYNGHDYIFTFQAASYG